MPQAQHATRYVIVAAFDDSREAARVAVTAASLATATSGAEIHFVHAVAHAKKDAIGQHAPHIEELARLARKTFAGPISGHLELGSPWRSIVQIAATLDADLVIVGATGREGLERLTMGSVAEQVTRHAHCPVLVVREKDHSALREPQIEPPCPKCWETQQQTNGKTLFCAQHRAHHVHGHTFHEYPPSFADGSNIIRPNS